MVYVDGEYEYDQSVPVYAYCARTENEASVYDYKGSLTVMILNLEKDEVDIDFSVKDGDNGRYELFMLITDGVINSVYASFNDKKIMMDNDNSLPDLMPMWMVRLVWKFKDWVMGLLLLKMHMLVCSSITPFW